MITTEFKGMTLPLLGMGCMRLPRTGGDGSPIDEEAVRAMVDYALENGITYFDTAWGYHNGKSEPVMGAALGRHPRDSFLLASKFPSYDVNNFGHVQDIFEQQLERCGVDHFDFYLCHNLCELNIEQYLDEERYGTMAYLLEQVRTGRIRHLGVSVHSEFETFERFMEAYGEHMEFCQLELNYEDWTFQDARAKVAYLNERSIPIWVMEPQRGGALSKLSDDQQARMDALRPGVSPVEWAFRFVQDVPGVTMVLSGMSNMQQLEQNIGYFDHRVPLADAERDELIAIGAEIAQATSLPCTACRYCTSHCPRDLNIPYLLSLYNEWQSKNGGTSYIAAMGIGALPEDHRPSACIACRSCEAVCPQQLPIASAMAKLAGKYEKRE